MDDNIKKLHQALIDDGYDDVGTEQEFRDYVSDSKNVATLYNALSEAGYDNFKDQKSLETYLSAKAPVAQKPSTPQSSGQSVSSQKKEQAEYPQEVLDAFNSPDNKPGNFKDLAQLNDEYQRGELKKPGIISQALGMFSNVDAGNIGKEQKVGGMIANMLLGDNVQQPHDNNQQVQHLNQDNVPATEQTKPTSEDADAITSAAPVQQVDAIYNKYVGKGDALSETMYDLMASGQAQNQEEAQNMAMGAMNRAASHLAQRTTDEFVSKLGDTVEGVDEAVMNGWHSHAVQDNLKKLASQYGIMNNVAVDENGRYITQTNGYDQFINGMVKPAMVESLVKKYGENYRKTAEDLATRLYSNDEVIQNQLMNQDINAALVDVIGKYVNPSVVDEYNKAQEAGSKAFTEGMEGSQFIPANLRLGTALGAQYEANEAKDPAKVLSSLQKKFGRLYRNPEFLNDMSNAAFKVMQRYGLNGTQSSDPKQFKPMINSVLKNELDQLEIKGMMPKGSAEYIMKTGLGNTIVGKITRKAVQTDYQNWLEDIANQQYHPGFWENVASGALTFAGDAWSYWLPGAAGGKLTKSMVAKAEGKLAGDLMAKGMERKMAERAAKVLIGKSKTAALRSGAAHGAVTFGGQSAISKPIDEIYRTGQFDENGKIYNPSVGKVIANTLGEVAKQSAVGAIMQGGTIANMVGKGRGLATNILADIGGKVVDSGIMTGHQMLERMAQDPNFKPTGKDAAESFLESMANLTAIGLPGMVGKYARFKDAREFNKKFDFSDQDIAELKRFGYDGLRDAFEKVGIGEYTVVGENAQRLDGQLTQKYMDLMNDKSVPEVLKAKMMAVVEGKRPSSFSPVVDSIIVQPMDNDGKVYLETLNKDGGIVERKEFASLDEAQKADKKLEYEKTLGLASVLEGEFHNEFTQEHLDGLYNKAAQKYNMGEKLTDEDKAAVYLHQNAGAIKEIMDKQQKGIILTDEEQKQVNAYRHYYDSALENSSVMREFVNTFEDSHGVARGTLRKALESKDKKYAPLVESYLKELYNSIELKREMKQTMDDLYNTSHGNEQKRIEQGGVDGAKPATPVEGPASVEGSASNQEPPVSEGPAPYQDRTNSVPTPSDAEVAANPANSAAEGAGNEPKVASSDAFVMGQNAYKNGDSEALQAIGYNSDLATGRLKRAFADNEKMPDIVANAYNEGRDMEQFVAQRASLTPAQKEAISKYVEAMDAKKGAIDALQHADDGYGDALKEQLWPYQTEDGNIVPATLDSGKQVFLKKANEYGGAFVVVPDEQGQPTIKQVSNAEIKEVGTPVSLDEYIENTVAQQKDARAQQFISQFDGSGLKPNDQVTVAMEEGDANINMTFAGYSKDGKIVLTDGKDYLPLSKEEFAAWRKNALDNTINEHLDAEDDEREQKAASQAEAEKKQRYANGIVGLSEGQPDYSSNDTDPNVAAEYLQEQFVEDHGKLLNLVNGSRDDIKTQLANKRKAAIEYQNWLDTNADLDPEKAKKVEDELSLVNEQIADLDARFKNWNTIRNSVMTLDEVKAMKEERKAEVEKAGVDESAIVPSDDFHVLVLEDEELKKQYPTMDEATDYITSQRKDLYHTQEDVESKINGVNDMLNQYINGETELDPSQLMELNTTKAQLEALQTNLSVAAKGLKAQANKLSKLYKTEVSKQEMEKLGMTPSEQRKALVADALKKNDMKAIHEIYKDASVDVMDLTPQTLEEAVSESLLPHSLNPESLQYELGKSNFKFGIGKRYDSNKFNYLIAKKGTGMSVNEFAVRVYNDLPVNLLDMGYSDQDVRNALFDMFKSYDSVKEMRNVALMNRIAAAEDELSSEEEYYEAQKEREIFERQAENPDYYAYLEDNSVPLPTENELNQIAGMEYDRMMEIEDREREYKQYVKSILPELADYDDRSNEEGYGGGSSLGSDSSRRGVDERNRNSQEGGSREASAEAETGALHNSTGEGRQEVSGLASGEGSADRTSHLSQVSSFGERLKSAIAETETEPTEAQKKAGNYKKGHLSFGGYDYTVETPKGVTRSGKDEQGKPWSVTMHDTYGYILGKIGVDGDHIDMFINDAADLDTFDGNVYVVDQVNPETGEFDEHKVMYGYPSEEAATEAYLANYSKGWKGLGKVTSVPKATFDKWLESSDRKTKPFAEYAMVQKEQRAAYKEEMMQDAAHSEAFDKIVDLAKEQKEYWDLMEQGEVDPNEVPEVDVAHEMDELLKTLSDEEFKEVSDVLQNIDEEFEYFTADEYERREDLAERKNAAAYSEFLKQETKSIAPFSDALRNAVNSGDKKAIAKAQKELTDALLASNLGHGYLSGQLEYAKSAKKKDESYSERRAFIKPLTDAINTIESALDSALADVGLEGVHVDFKEYGYGWIYADKGSDWRDRLEPLDNDYRNVSQYSDVNPISALPQITMNNVKKVAGIIKSRIEEGERYNSDENQDENIEEAKKAKDDFPFHRDVKEVKPENLTEAQKVAYDAVSTMLHKAGIPVKVVSNEDMEKVADAQDNMAVEMLLNDPRLRFYIKTPEQKEAAKAAYDWAAKNRPDKFKQYAIVNMDNPNQPPQYFEKKDLAEKWRKYYTNAWKIGNYKAFNLNKPFEEQIKDVKGDVPSEFDPYKAESLLNKRIELEKQIKETEDSYNAKKKERAEYQNQLMQDYMDQHGLSSENDIPDDVWTDYRDKSFEKYQDTLDDLFHKYVELDNQLKAVAEPGVRFLRTYHGSGANFSEFDFDHMSEGAGSQVFGWGGYVTSSKKIGKDYASIKYDPDKDVEYVGKNKKTFTDLIATLFDGGIRDYNYVKNTLLEISDNDKSNISKKEEYDWFVSTKPEDWFNPNPTTNRNLYEVNIPEDNGSNYLEWEKTLTEKQINAIRDALAKNGVDISSFEKRGFKLDLPFKYVYTTVLPMMMHSKPKDVSKFLSSLGFTGIKYPAGTIMGGAEEGDTNYVIFKPEDMKIVDHTKFAQGKGVVYGYTDGKQIVLNQEHLNPNTPIHEYQHLWRTAAKEMNPELIEHGDKLIMQTQLFADLKQDPNYNHLTDEQICDEAFARLTGEDGAAILEQMAKDAIKENPLDTAKELSVINKLKEWLKKFWYWALDTFTKWKPEDIKKMTLEDIRNLVLRDLANGVDPRTKFHEAENADDIKFMGSTTKKRMKDISTQLEGRELDEAQQAVADVYSGKKDNVSLTVEREDGSNKIIMRQGNDNHAGTKHSVFRHYGVKANSLNVDDLLLIPTVLKEGERKVSDNGRVAYVYVDPTSQVKYTVVTEPKNNKEIFNDFYSNKKANPSETSRVVENSTNTPEGAHNNDGNAFMRAKVDNNSETAKENGENLSVEDKIKAVSQQFGVDEADVAMYANAIKKGSTAEAARARANIKRHLLQANEDKISSFKELLKYTVPVNEALKENFGDVDAMIEERKQQMEAQRNAMEAARKRAEEEEAKRQKHLEELSQIPEDQLDKQYMDALAKGDDATAREMLDEAARRKGYDDTESAYQGVGAWAAPGNPGYESDKARRDDWESSGSDVNLEDIALGYTPQPDDYFSHPERYSQNTPHGLESVKAINTAIDAIKNGEKDVKVKVYRAVPTSVKEGKLRNGDWVTPSKKYAEMHGTNRLDGKYRIIEDEVPANQLWWDGNDANEFGFDDGKEYKYKNAKNNRKLNDLVTYDDEGDVIPPSKRFNSRKQDVRFHRVTEPEELDRLNKEKTFRMYSGMQEVDGKLYSPMAAIIDGKRTDATEIGAWMGADERPDLVKNGKFQLVKTDKNPGAGEGPVPAAYNPYMHTSTSVMNDQFSGAYARGNIKVVEWEIPESEKTSGYHAEGAKDSVGLVPWTSGTVNSLLPKDRQRSVMLSRWRKAVRIVPDEEVAEKIAAQLSGTGLAIPWNVVTPNQLRELAKLGVPITTVEQGRQNPEVKEKFLKQMAYLKKEFPQAQFVDVKMTKDAFKEWGGKGIVKSPIMDQKLKKHPDSLMKAGTYFSGGGLVEEGLKGIIDPVVAVEYDRKISGVYRNNFGQHIVTADVRDVDPKELVKHIDGEVEYFHASPVCKNYSQAKSNSGEVELDKETAKSTADFIDAVKPRVVTIENVQGYKDSEAMKIITKALDKNGYTWDSDVYNAADYGGYTSRERLIVRAVKDGELPEKPKKQPRKGGWLEAVEDILPTLTVKESGVAPWMDARLNADGIDWQKVEKPLYVMGSAYADGKIPHAYGDEILPTLRTKSGDVIIMPGGKVLRADGRVLARITGLGDDYLLPKTESLAHTIIGNGIPVQLTQGVIAPLLNKDDLSGRNVLARLGSSIFKNNLDADKQKQVSDLVVNTANKLGGAEATVYTSVDEVPDAYLSDVKNGATGWYDPITHTVHVYLPNCADANEAERTVLHEKIGHEGMEVLLGGEDGVRKFANFVYRSVGKDVRGKIIDFANKYDPDWKNPDRMNVGTQEYIAHLAEEGPMTAEDFSLWTKIKHYLIKVFKKLGVRVPGLLNDKDLRYYLMKAGKALHVWDEMPQEKQEAMMKQASNAEIKDALSDGAGKGKPQMKKGESTIQYIKRVQEWRKWQNAREDKENPEPPMFYDIDKDEAGKKEWAQLNKDWRERHHLVGEEPTGMPIRMENEEDDAYMNRIHEYEKWQAAMKDQEDPLPDMFAFEKKKQEEVKRKYEDWLAKHDLLEQQQADLDLYEGKIYPAETNPKADALEQQVMQDLAEVTSTDVSKEGAAKTVKYAVIHRRKNMEEASADDAIYINDVKNRIEKMADSGAFDKLLSDYQGKPNRAEKLAEAIPYIIEAPRRLRDMAHNLNATGVFDKGHIHIQPADVEAIQPFVADLITETGKKHTELKDGKEVEVYDDPQAVSDVASKMAQAINANHQVEEGFVPIDGSDILSEHVLPLVKQQIVPEGIDYKNLSPEMKAAIDSIRDWYNYTYDWLKDNHTLKEDTGYNADYVNHIWDKEKSNKRAYAMYVENRQRTKSPNEKPRTISTLMEGISVGLVPKTTDITKMMSYYSRSNIEAWVNKTMLQELSGLNVIERNEDGEIISSDPLLSSTPPFNLEQYQYFEIPGIGPVWVYKGNAKDYTIPNIITGKKILLYRQKSAAKRFGVVFEQYESSPFWETVDTLASSAKKLELGFSGFHAGALTEVYMVQNMVEFGPKKAMANFMKYIFVDTMKNHELPCFANPEDFQEAATHLVKFGATNDYAAADVQNMFDNMRDAMMKVQEKLKDGNGISGTVALATMPLKVATQMLSLINKGMDRALWDFLHDGLKLATYRMRADKTKERAKKKGWTVEELSRALDEDGQFVNDMFGGQHWDVLGASHRTLRYAGRVLLSPDWNASTTRHFLALTGYGSIWNEATFENFKQYYSNLLSGSFNRISRSFFYASQRNTRPTDDSRKYFENLSVEDGLTPNDEGRRSRQISSLLCYGIGFMVFYEVIANGINAAFRALDEEKERKKAEEMRKTNPNYRSMYELAYGDEGMKWYDYLMRGNSLGQQSKIFLGRYEDGTEMYVRHGKQFREVPEYLFNHKGELEFPGPMVQRMIGKANPMVRMTLDDINYLSDFQASHADQEIQRKYGKAIGLLYKDALYWAPFLIPSQENKEFKAVDFFFPSSKGFSPWKAQSYFKDFILSGDMEGVVMTYQSCQRNGIDPEAQIKAAIGSVKALESAEMSDGVTSLQEASKRFDTAKSITEKKKMRQKMKKFLSQSDYKAFTQKEALDMVQGYLNGDEDLKEMEKAESKYLMKAKAEDVTEDWRIQNVWNGTMKTYQEYQRLKDVDKAKANAFKNSKTNKRLFAARKAISAARRKMNKAKKQMDGTNDAAKLVEIRNTRKELLKTLNGME